MNFIGIDAIDIIIMLDISCTKNVLGLEEVMKRLGERIMLQYEKHE